jgi:predicted DNA-binding transcriptional regulator YafY
MPAEQRKDLIRRMLSPSTSLTSRVIEQRLGAAGHAVTRRTLERDLQELLDAGEAVASDGKPRGFRRGAIDAFRLRRELDPAEAVLFRLAEAHLRQSLFQSRYEPGAAGSMDAARGDPL